MYMSIRITRGPSAETAASPSSAKRIGQIQRTIVTVNKVNMNDESCPRFSSSYTIWNDFESSYSSELCSESPTMSPFPIMPTCQSTPLAASGEDVFLYSGETFEDDFISPIAKRRRLCSLNSSQSSLYDNCTKNVDFNDFETASEESFTTTPLETTPQQTSQQSNSSQLLGLSCCGSRCLARLSLLELESCRKTFQNRTYIEQRQYLLDTLSVTALCTEGEEGSKNLECNQLKLAGKSLCKVAFLRVLEVSEKRMRNVTRLYVEGATISRPRLYLQRRNSSKLSTAVAWMERYFNRLGDKMPHLQQLHLPSFLSKKMVYELMVQDLSDEGLCKPDIISSSHFYAVWKDKFHNCIIPKVRE